MELGSARGTHGDAANENQAVVKRIHTRLEVRADEPVLVYRLLQPDVEFPGLPVYLSVAQLRGGILWAPQLDSQLSKSLHPTNVLVLEQRRVSHFVDCLTRGWDRFDDFK